MYLGRRDFVVNVEPFSGEDIGQSRGPSLGKEVLNFHLGRFSLFNGHHPPAFGEDPLDDFMAPIPKLIRENIQIHDQHDVGISRLAGLFGDDYIWSVLPVGRHQFALGTVAMVMGGSVRVGLEDNLYLSKGELAKSNADLVAKIRRIIEELSFEIASPVETRQMLELKGKAQTDF